jgi:hypothetical protein
MKKSDRLRREAETTMKKIRGIVKHIRNVEDNCLILGEKLIERGEINLGRHLIANGYVHDASKFHGIEFEFMAPGENCDEEGAKMKLKLAIHHHRTTNLHHPEAWSGGIVDMPDVYLAEMICDLKARSEEFGTGLMDYIEKAREERWQIPSNHPIYIKIVEYVKLLCATPFAQV